MTQALEQDNRGSGSAPPPPPAQTQTRVPSGDTRVPPTALNRQARYQASAPSSSNSMPETSWRTALNQPGVHPMAPSQAADTPQWLDSAQPAWETASSSMMMGAGPLSNPMAALAAQGLTMEQFSAMSLQQQQFLEFLNMPPPPSVPSPDSWQFPENDAHMGTRGR